VPLTAVDTRDGQITITLQNVPPSLTPVISVLALPALPQSKR